MIVQTPGVYIKEQSTLPNSIAGVSTAVPVFIGFTEKEETAPQRISSMMEFERIFGSAFPSQFNVSVSSTNNVTSVLADKRYFLYDSLHLYFRNGGGPCHIISAGKFSVNKSTFQTKFTDAIAKIDTLDEVTLALIPDLHYQYKNSGEMKSLTPSLGYGTVVNALLNKCSDAQDKFAILDYQNNETSKEDMRDWIAPTTGALKYGALYYPWLNNAELHNVTFESIKGYNPASSLEARNINLDLDSLSTNLGVNYSSEALVTGYKSLIASFDAASTLPTQKTALKNIVNFLTNSIKAFDLSTIESNAYAPAVANGKTNANLTKEVKVLYRLRNLLIQAYGITPSTTYDADGSWYGATPTNTLANIIIDSSLLPDDTFEVAGSSPTSYISIEDAVKQIDLGSLVNYRVLFSALGEISNAVIFQKQLIVDQLFANDVAYINIQKAIQAYMQEVPSQGAMAGIYCQNDRDRGVWKSPANVAVQGIRGPLVEVSNREQENLNVDPATGKSINVIRTFTGRGSLVWGARTLEGNSNEWRYIGVRRFFNYAEESIKKSMNSFVFEPNNARTWVKIKAMITSFLVDQWRAGALTGTTSDEAFFVRVGNDTTSPAEILNGKINVQIGMAVARPAEFIILEFSHFTQ